MNESHKLIDLLFPFSNTSTVLETHLNKGEQNFAITWTISSIFFTLFFMADVRRTSNGKIFLFLFICIFLFCIVAVDIFRCANGSSACVCVSELMYRWYHTVDLSRSWWDVFRKSVSPSWIIRLSLLSCAIHDSCGLKNSAQWHGSLSFRHYIIWHSLRLLSFFSIDSCVDYGMSLEQSPVDGVCFVESATGRHKRQKRFISLIVCTFLLFIYRWRRHCCRMMESFIFYYLILSARETTCIVDFSFIVNNEEKNSFSSRASKHAWSQARLIVHQLQSENVWEKI